MNVLVGAVLVCKDGAAAFLAGSGGSADAQASFEPHASVLFIADKLEKFDAAGADDFDGAGCGTG